VAHSLPEFEPFRSVPYLKKLEPWPSSALLPLLPVIMTALFIVVWREGTIGGPRDFQPFEDIQRALGAGDPPVADPEFPLWRDLASLYLIAVICLTVPLIHLQWHLMSRVIGSLSANGVLVEKASPEYKRIHKLMRLPRVLPASTGATQTERLLNAANRWLDKLGRSSGWLVGISFVLALFLAIGPNRNGLFRALSGELAPAATGPWLADAYRSWWASISHPGGFILYVLLMALGIFLVLIQNSVGLTAVYTLIGLTAVSDLNLDWYNRDGNFGWESVSSTFRTVVLSLALHGSALSVTLIALGTQNFPWVFGVVLIWVVMLPSVTLGPLYAFKGLSKRAQQQRVNKLVGTFASSPDAANLLRQEEFRSVIAGARTARAKPLRLRKAEIPAFFVLVLLPIILTGVQVYFSVKYGNSK
jgi:hypothetical protein